MAAVKEAIDTANDALELYNKVLDQLVPWKGFKEEITKLDTATLSRENADHAGNVKTQLLNVIDEYDSATQSIYEWCALSESLLKTYIALQGGDAAKQAMQRKFVANVLDHGMKKIVKAQGHLDECIDCFSKTSEHLTPLGNANLKSTVEKALTDTKQTKEKLYEKVQKMTELKAICGESNSNATDETGAIEAAEKLIATCNDYRNNHAQ